MEIPNPFSQAVKQVRYLVSRDKNRYVEADFDLDLTYINDRIIAMGFPADDTAIQSAWRNTLSDVAKLLNSKHKDKYQVYNLCAEKKYDCSRLDNRVVEVGWPDHHSPSLKQLIIAIQSIESWLKADPEHVVAVHCMAGRGRTGTVISSYLLWSKACSSPEEALSYFAAVRSAKGEGVGVPSQLRYVHYIDQIIKKEVNPFPPTPLILSKILIKSIPSITFNDAFTPCIEICDVENQYNVIHRTSQFKEYSKKDFCAFLEPNAFVSGDVLIRFYHQLEPDMKKWASGSPMVCRVAFHTSFIKDYVLDLTYSEIDSPSQGKLNDKRFPPDFMIRLIFAAPTN